MNKISENITFIRVDKQTSGSRELIGIDFACLQWVLRGTWIFSSTPDLHGMKHALKSLIEFYPHLAGRIGKLSRIEFTNAGVPFIVVFDPTLMVRDQKFVKQEWHFPISPSRIKNGKDPLLAIKVTIGKDGWILGVTGSHVCMDGDSFYTMVRNWSRLYSGENIIRPLHDPSCYPGPKPVSREVVIQMAQKRGWLKASLYTFIKMLFPYLAGKFTKRIGPYYISKPDLEILKNKIGGETGFHYSNHEVLAAFISKKILDYSGYHKDTKCTMVTVINIRDRVGNIPATFTGNASSTVTSKPFGPADPVSEISSRIHETLEPYKKKPSPELTEQIQLGINAFHLKLPYLPFDIPGMNRLQPTVFYVNNFSRYPVYDVTFGTGTPLRVIPHDLGDPIVIWPAPPEKDGVEIYFSGNLARLLSGIDLAP